MGRQTHGRHEWLHVGQGMLRAHGATSVKLIPLVEAAGMTSGSFYHHYTGIPEYLADLARTYGTHNADALIAEAHHPDPIQRLRRLHAALHRPDFRPLDVAMRDWAGTNEVAAASVQDFDAAIFRFIEEAFAELGHPRSDARARAVLLFGSAVARMNPPWRGSSTHFDEALALLTSLPHPTRPAPAAKRAART